MTKKWEAYYHNEKHWVVHTDTALIADCFSGTDSKRNAHLIAAAPEMYELLRRVAYGSCDDCMPLMVSARDLLARIDGEEDNHE